ncbi:acetyl-CoA acetyltransferase [Pandoraea pneumonica]|uniref:Acetyl-CoA acetyltransferase n=1 Tax=Pandoraea pneumonica TaxID=2508299 RepID=A0A5E4WGL2_9BURK|nr:acetyl-CoA acetyltransferase [Pandoraea pneumonica]VVE22205.1 acetyl-CoA acetyltransferase [Pandoraea pneumonica]
MVAACLTGWAHSQFGKLDNVDAEVLLAQVAQAALDDAGLAPEQIDSIHVGTFNGGFLYQDFPSSLVFNNIPGLRFKPATRYENACATGSAAVHGGLQSIEAGKATHVLVIGFEKMTELANPQVGEVLLKCSYAREEAGIPGGFAGVFGTIAQQYFDRYGDQSDALARIAAKNHRNGTVNPYAHMRRDFGYDFCRNVSEKNPFVAGPLKRTDCSMVSDGAAALVISKADVARTMPKAVGFRAAVQVNDYLPLSRRDALAFEGGQHAWRQALGVAGLSLKDLSLVETHDCFTIAELIEYEAMGLAKPGQGASVVAEGLTEKDGLLPVNPSGGLKAKGHPVGATGVSMHVMAAMQLTGTAGEMQIPNAKLAGVFNMGGAAVANYVSILEAR